MPRAYPVHLRMSGRSALVVGAGRVAQRRVARLLAAGADVHVVAPEATEAVKNWAREGALRWSPRRFEAPDCQKMRLVFAATSETQVNAQVEAAGRTAGAWVNRVDAPERCDFWVPAAAVSEACSISLSTEGRAPSASRRLAREVGRWLRAGPDRFVRAMEQARETLRGPEGAARLRALADGPLFDACMAGDEDAVQGLLHTGVAEEGDTRG